MVSVPNWQDVYRLKRIQAGAGIALLSIIHQGANIILIPHEISEFNSKCCLTNSNDQDLPPATWGLSPDTQVQTVMLELSEAQPNYLFCNQSFFQQKSAFFFFIHCFEKKCQFWQYFVSRTSCPKTKHSLKVEVAHVNISGMESFQF